MADEEVAAPPKRKLPFKRTVARQQPSNADTKKADDDDNDLDLFRHSKEVFPEILREAQEAEEEKERQEHERKRRKLSASLSDKPQDAQDRSATPDSSDDDLIMDVKGKGKEIVRPRRLTTPAKGAQANPPRTPGSTSSNTQTPVSRRSASKNPACPPALPVTIIDSDSDPDYIPPRRRQKSVTRTPPPRNRPSSSSPSRSSLPQSRLATPPSPLPAAADDDFSEWVLKARALQQQAQQTQNAVITILVTSPLTDATKTDPDTGLRPFLARRRLNQTVQLLLDAWVEHARKAGIAVPDDVASGLFLTWKGHKIYGHSTPASLGVQVDAQGRVKSGHGRGGADEPGYYRDGLHLEVWDEEAYAAHVQARGRKRAMDLDDDDDDDDDDGGCREGRVFAGAVPQEEQAGGAVAQKRKGIRIVLKAKEHEALKLTTREETDVGTLIEAFRTQRGIGPEWEVSIWFDGERLEEDSLVTDIDIDPDEANQLEVLVKKAAQ
ncbi:hypothetical protein NEMBOFW57_007626 [Staphylotrichum longicolle]|uniref:Rad60/SUMO-like domain-containing protein n=1 Tax=Staphylotrichum longicolle TaxID=669026 RepID=A0AAD4EUZ2_9PEZI|nr:hypothetical protein NEMBOFW57_007626 [Staphylotrichum longicolle]